MKAMILCAGIGKRLRPITNAKPKALLYIDRGLCLLEIVIRRLKFFGFDDIVINLHYLHEQIISFLKKRNYFSIKISFSYESEKLLDTGGALKHARSLLEENNTKPFLLCNVDMLTNLDLALFYKTHIASKALATLAVQDKRAQRGLFFDQDHNLCGWKKSETDNIFIKRAEDLKLFAFSGIHIINMDIFDLIREEGVFSIIDLYIRLSKDKYIVKAYCHNSYCIDAGTYKDILRASAANIKLAPL